MSAREEPDFEIYVLGHEVVGPGGRVMTSKIVGASGTLAAARSKAIARSRSRKWREASRMVVLGLRFESGHIVSQRLVAYRSGRRERD